MSVHQLEHYSIILEVIAFFFVTVDLYGEKRMITIQNKFRSIHSSETDDKVLDIWFDIRIFKHHFFSLLMIIGFILMIFTGNITFKNIHSLMLQYDFWASYYELRY